jgi:hypothetical protein
LGAERDHAEANVEGLSVGQLGNVVQDGRLSKLIRVPRFGEGPVGFESRLSPGVPTTMTGSAWAMDVSSKSELQSVSLNFIVILLLEPKGRMYQPFVTKA